MAEILKIAHRRQDGPDELPSEGMKAMKRFFEAQLLGRDHSGPSHPHFDILEIENRSRLSAFYHDYMSTVSGTDREISLALSYFLLFLCEQIKPGFILDLGSGFGSFVFRWYQANLNPSCEVCSVDDDPAWLEKTRQYLLKKGLSTDHLWEWKRFIRRPAIKFDLILHDIGDRTGRARSLPRVLKLLHPQGALILDDMHKPHYREPIKKILRRYSGEWYDLSAYTLDEFGRYAWLWGDHYAPKPEQNARSPRARKRSGASNKAKTIVLYSQHLAGMGHHFRTLQVARALARNHSVHFISDGRPIPRGGMPDTINRISLRPIPLKGDALALETAFRKRMRLLAETIQDIRPDILIVEHFPFGRWVIRPAILQMLEAGRRKNPGMRMLCSLRDIPFRSPTKELVRPNIAETPSDKHRQRLLNIGIANRYYENVCPVLNAFFDALLIHGDPKVTRLEEHFPWVEDISIPIAYTGYVSEKPDRTRAQPEEIKRILKHHGGFVLVSAGGGSDGYGLIARCIEAWRRLCGRNAVGYRKMVIFSGPFISAADYRTLQKMCAGGAFHFKRFTPDFLSWLQSADFSISHAGYNTCVNVLETRVPALLAPLVEADDQELRADRLSEMGLVDVIASEDLSATRIGDAILRGLSQPPSTSHSISLDGAEYTNLFVSRIQ